MSASLAGCRIAVTRPRERAEDWIEAFTAAGAEVISVPTFALQSVHGEESAAVVDVVRRFADADEPWLAFTSVPAVTALLDLLSAAGVGDLEDRFRIAVIGDATRAAVTARGKRVALQAPRPSAQDLAAALLESDLAATVLHVTSSIGLPILVDLVTKAGGTAESVVVYRQERVTPDVQAAAKASVLTFASPSAARGLLEAADSETGATLREIPTVAVGETTATALSHWGFSKVAVAASPAVEDMLKRVAEVWKR